MNRQDLFMATARALENAALNGEKPMTPADRASRLSLADEALAVANTDPLDAAYLAIGAARMLDALSPAEYARATLAGGEMTAVERAVSYSSLLQRLWDEVGEEWGGVWAYEVAETLGNWIVSHPDATDSEVETAARTFVGCGLVTP